MDLLSKFTLKWEKLKLKILRARHSKLPRIAIKINKLLRKFICPSLTHLLYIHFSDRIQNIVNFIPNLSSHTDRNYVITLIEEIAFNLIFIYRYDNYDSKNTPSRALTTNNFFTL